MIKIIKENDSGYTFCVKAESGQTLLNSVVFSDADEMKRTINQLGRGKKRA